MVTQNYTISTVKVATPPKVKMSQYDYGMRTITFAVVDGSGAAVDLTGKTVTVEGTRIDGHAFATTCTVADNAATFVDTVDMTNAAGDHPAELVVRQNDERLGTMNFIISVEPAAMDEGADVSPEDKNLFEQLYAKVVSGSPVAVDTVAEMTNTDGVYLYTGNETGYTKGYWYYYDGSAWVAGGAYGSGATDKTLTLSDVAADAKVVGDYLDEISEGILESYVTEGSYTSAGVTTERISDTELKVYGTCTANRRFNVYNGFQTIRTTSSPFQAMLPAGTYRVSLSANKTTGNPRVTFSYTTYADALWTILNGQTVVYEFTQPFMFGFYANTNINYGTADDPTIVTLRIESITAKDEVARSKVDSIAIHETASGSVVTFPDGADGYPLKALTVAIEPVQSGSGDPSPSNIRPISGFSEVKVTRCGVNIWDEEWQLGSITTTTGAVAPGNNVISKNLLTVIPNTNYYTTQRLRLFFYDADENFLSYRDIAAGSVLTTPSGCYYMRFTAFQAYGTTYNHDISINYPSADTSYHAYQGKTYTISIGETVYGGTLDVVKGKMVVDKSYYVIDGSMVGTPTKDSNIWRTPLTVPKPVGENNNYKIGICNKYIFKDSYANTSITNNSISFGRADGTMIFIHDNSLTTAQEVIDSITTVPITAVYPLATPYEITLTPTQINTLLGVNNVYSDAGNVEVEYPADTKQFILNAIASALA